MSEGICQIELQNLSNDYQDQVLGYSTEVSSLTAFGTRCGETCIDRRGTQEQREKGLPPRAIQTFSP